ncbi:RNA-binding protein, putative [Plasmodium sp. gorilla clade G2]|uniref:RNA-binding protein, putative n=1 Tax=Plasmodium sp. gorilla clade G2 TaxID=880535 RepID=UPI000D2004A3|nr:RNA-binding protein, putative [Plasmodium sp. gorilla clade G2]SOV10994.1 RNA-binding protein, putative [Plasmodium sp. gorilla clade G2]
MGLFDKIRNIEKLNEAELKNIGNNDSSWHDQYRDSSYIYIGNLDNRLTEGDIVIVFSQYGEPIDVNLVRDNETGKSKGYCFLSYADQRSTILAVDNFNGYKLLERPLVVDHILNYRLPKKYLKDEDKNEYKPTGAEGQGIGVYNVVESEIKLSKIFDKIKNKSNEEKKKKLLDEDELWALNFEKSIKKDIISPIGHDEKSRHNEGMKEEEEDYDDDDSVDIKYKRHKEERKSLTTKKYDKKEKHKKKSDHKDKHRRRESHSRHREKDINKKSHKRRHKHRHTYDKYSSKSRSYNTSSSTDR